jgi:hypothetical protein
MIRSLALMTVIKNLGRHSGVFFSFSRGIRENVLGNLFSSKDLLWEQVEAEKTKEGES